MCLTGPPEPWLCLLGLDQRLPTPSQSREALTPLAVVVPGQEQERNLCHSHQPQPWQAGLQSGMLGSSCPCCSAGASLPWHLALLQRSSSSQCWDLSQVSPAAFSTVGVCWGEGSAPCPAANTQLQVSMGEKLLQHIQGTSSPPAKHKLCAKPGSDRHNMSFTKPFWPLPFFLSFHVLYLSLEMFKTSFDKQEGRSRCGCSCIS